MDEALVQSSSALTILAKVLCTACVLAGPALNDLEHAEEGKFTATALYKQIQGESKLQRREAGDLPHHSHDYGKAHFADVGHDEHTATPGTLICRAVTCLATLITAQPTPDFPTFIICTP